MTIAEFLDDVDWKLMRVTQSATIRDIYGDCPLVSAFGGDNECAPAVGLDNGLSTEDVDVILSAADNDSLLDEAVALRADMLRRIQAANS